MSGRERQLWTEFVRKREERKDEKETRKRRAKKPQSLRLRLMISPTRSRDLVSGGLTALLAALEGAQQTGPEAVVHPHEPRVGIVAALLVARLR
jgi:hypothetical protein